MTPTVTPEDILRELQALSVELHVASARLQKVINVIDIREPEGDRARD